MKRAIFGKKRFGRENEFHENKREEGEVSKTERGRSVEFVDEDHADLLVVVKKINETSLPLQMKQLSKKSSKGYRWDPRYFNMVWFDNDPEIESKYHHCNLCLVLFNNSYLEFTRWHYYLEYVFSYIS